MGLPRARQPERHDVCADLRDHTRALLCNNVMPRVSLLIIREQLAVQQTIAAGARADEEDAQLPRFIYI